MEAAALFAVAKYRGAQAAAAFSISDVLSDSGWNQRFGSKETKAGLKILLNLAIGAHRAIR
jgi:purine-nucleoside phosphorylase